MVPRVDRFSHTRRAHPCPAAVTLAAVHTGDEHGGFRGIWRFVDMPLKVDCHACSLAFHAESEDELVVLAAQHALDVHGHSPPREHVLARIRKQNRAHPTDDPEAPRSP